MKNMTYGLKTFATLALSMFIPFTSFAAAVPSSASTPEPWWLDTLIDLLIFILGSWFVIWKIGKEYRVNLNIRQEDFKDRLKLDIYEKIANKIDTINKKSNGLNVGLTLGGTFKLQRDLHKDLAAIGRNSKPISARMDKISADYFGFVSSVLDMIFLLERYEIVMPNSKVFRMAFQATIKDLYPIFTEFTNIATKFLPIDLTEEEAEKMGITVFVPPYPSDDEIYKIEECGRRFFGKCLDIQSYAFDLGVETQNLFLGNMFPSRVEGRKPTDPSHLVITIADKEALRLEKHFLENTPWGKEWAEYKSKGRKSTSFAE